MPPLPDHRSPGDGVEPTRDVDVAEVRDGSSTKRDDRVAVEEPLEIRLGYHFLDQPARRSISVTMRTPGADRELAAGFLYGENIIAGRDDIGRLERPDDDEEPSAENIIELTVPPDVEVDVAKVQRNFYTTSSCGVCGKASLEALEVEETSELDPEDFRMSAKLVARLPDRLRSEQPVFEQTGGIHAAGLFDTDGQLLELREDVGRHNAMDKLVGARLLAGELPAEDSAVVLSGRASFELLQKALRARIPLVVAVGAPSSLAVDLADEFGITLVGFARGDRFNVYTHPERIGTS